ncbi:MAG: TrmB family transcriptional regulator [Firmicutes bacterium]|nr:TrmB family transcriptional regulator [Bacillota bacterium]
MKSNMIEILQDLDLTEYEAKAYLALLEKSPISGYAVALNSGVPRSKIYEVLGSLVQRGEVIMSHGNPSLYAPLPPKELIARRRLRTEAILKAADEALERYACDAMGRGNIWNITGYHDIFNRVKEVIRKAKGRILLEIWKEDAEEIEEDLREASRNGVEILIVGYGNIEFSFAQVYPHDLGEEITDEYGGRWVVLSADDREIVAGIVSLGDDSRAAWTMHPGLAMPITEVIKHDLYIMEMLKEHRPLLEASFGPNLIHLRNRFRFGPPGVSVAAKLGLLK